MTIFTDLPKENKNESLKVGVFIEKREGSYI